MQITRKEFENYFQPPFKMQDFFIIETIDTSFSILDTICSEIEKQFQVKIPTDLIRLSVLNNASAFHKNCKTCEQECFYNYHRRLPQDAYEQMNIDRKFLPKTLQKTNAAHFYMLELSCALCNGIDQIIQDYINNEEITDKIIMSFFEALAYYYQENCIKTCKYKCFKRSHSSAYCDICSLISSPIACPLKNEISLEDIGEDHFVTVCPFQR